MGYWMHKTSIRFISRYLLFLPFLLFLPIFFLATVTNMEVVKINPSFLLLFFKTLASIIIFFFAKKALNVKKVFFIFFSNNVDTYYREVLTSILCLSTMVPRIFLVFLVFFSVLVSGRLLLPTRRINKEGINRLILPKVLFSFFAGL